MLGAQAVKLEGLLNADKYCKHCKDFDYCPYVDNCLVNDLVPVIPPPEPGAPPPGSVINYENKIIDGWGQGLSSVPDVAANLYAC